MCGNRSSVADGKWCCLTRRFFNEFEGGKLTDFGIDSLISNLWPKLGLRQRLSHQNL